MAEQIMGPGSPAVRVANGRVKITRAELSGDYEGKWLLVWTNPKRGMLRVFGQGDEVETDRALASLVLEHNLTTETGAAYPNPLTLDALEDMPLDLYRLVVEGVGQAIAAGNKLPLAQNGESANGL